MLCKIEMSFKNDPLSISNLGNLNKNIHDNTDLKKRLLYQEGQNLLSKFVSFSINSNLCISF